MVRRVSVLAWVTLLTGIAAGMAGMLLARLLRLIQHLAFAYGSGESFLNGVISSSPLRRAVVLSVCGAIAGIGWGALRRAAKPLVSIRDSVENGKEMPPLATIAHDLLQILTVGLGSPLGREVAPREMGALVAGALCRGARLSQDECRVLIACGAGAGLAAVYNAPLGGALFALEVLLGTFRLSAAIPAIATSAIAAWVASFGLGDETAYVLPRLAVAPSLIAWSLVAGPMIGLCAHWFSKAASTASARAPRDWRLVAWCGAVFPLIGLISILFPQVLGNGKSIASLGFDSTLTVGGSAALLVMKTAVVVGALRAGASGGLMTPGIAIGACLGTLSGGIWSHIWPGVASGDFAVIGGTAFLAASMRMPVTAIVLMIEFTRVDHDFLIPMALAATGSVLAYSAAGSQSATTAAAVLHSVPSTELIEHERTPVGSL